MFFKKLKAVSYVEVVLVLVIVGVISAIAIPSLKRYSQREELGRQTQKAYLTLTEAFDQAVTLYGPSRKWATGQAAFTSYIVPQLQVYKTVSGTQVITKDGMDFRAGSYASGEWAYLGIIVDVNGSEKGPNKYGKDIHIFDIKYNTGKVEPSYADTVSLYENNWKFTDGIWNK